MRHSSTSSPPTVRLGSTPSKPSLSPLFPPRIRVAGRARTWARGQLVVWAAAATGEGRGYFLWGPTPLARRAYRACALPPGLHLGIGRKREREREREAGTRAGLWCGEKLRRKGKGVRHRDHQQRLRYSPSAVSEREDRKGSRPGLEWGLSLSDPSLRGAVQPGVLGVGPLWPKTWGSGPWVPNFGAWSLVSQIPRYQALVYQISRTQVSTFTNLGLCFIEFKIPGIQDPVCTSIRGSSSKRSDIGLIFSPCKYTGLRPHNRKSGIEQLSPSSWGRTGPRGQIRLSPPPLQGRLPGPAPQEGRKLRKRWRGGRSPCPSPCLSEQLEYPRRKRRRWGTIVTPTR